MVWRARRLLAAGVLLLSVLGCSFLTAQVRGGHTAGADADRALRPGPGPVTVEGLNPGSARVSWYSPWRGRSVVRYGTSPDLGEANATRATDGTRLRLDGLTPGTRYFLRVETRTSQGLSCSSVCSFVPQ